MSTSSSANGSAEWPPDDRLRRMIQYSRASVISGEVARTGYSAFAEYDGRVWGGATPYDFAPFFVTTFFPTADRLSSFSSALRTCLNSSSEAASTFGNLRSSPSSALTMAEPITTRANHLWSAGTTYQGAAWLDVCRTIS